MIDLAKKTLVNIVKFIYDKQAAWEVDEYIEVKAPYSYKYKLPANFVSLPARFAEQYGQDIDFPAQRIYYLSKVFATWQGLVFKNLRVFLPSLQQPELEEYFKEPMLLKQWFGKKVHLTQPEGVAIVHGQYAPENYYHWLLDTLPRLLLLRQYHSADIPLLLLEPMAEFVQVTTAALGFTNIIPVTKQQVLQIDKVVLPGLLSYAGHVDPTFVRAVRDELQLKLLGEHTLPEPSKRLYVSRARQKRTVANPAAFEALLARYNFETIYFEDLSMAEQIATMQQATVVLSVHGANLVNIIYMQSPAKVIELVSEKLHNPAYWRLSDMCALPYYVLPCKPSVEEDYSTNSNADLLVDEVQLEALLKSVLPE